MVVTIKIVKTLNLVANAIVIVVGSVGRPKLQQGTLNRPFTYCITALWQPITYYNLLYDVNNRYGRNTNSFNGNNLNYYRWFMLVKR